MAYPLSAYYGRITIAKLDACAYCGRPFDDANDWHTVKSAEGNVDLWCIACDKCFDKARVIDGVADARQ